jgi:subtilase family serine protease
MLFYCSVESRVLPGGRFNKLPDHQGGVWITSLKPYERQTQRWAYEILPVGSQREYRVRIDPMNWIWEKKEDNNEGTSIWPATRTH